MISIIDWLWRRKARRDVLSLGSPPLIMLPATHRAARLAADLCRARPCWVTRGRIFEAVDASEPLHECLRSPLEIMRLCAAGTALPRPVITVPEQIVGNGPSFRRVEFLGRPRYFSTLECLLAARNRPTLLTARSVLGQRGYALYSVDYAPALDGALDEVLRHLLQPIEAETRLNAPDWVAGACLAAKTEEGFRSSLREDCRDLEAVLRMFRRDGVGDPSSVLSMLGCVLEYSARRSASSEPV
jgi:hypothetical protein